jgi:hypothetical protein
MGIVLRRALEEAERATAVLSLSLYSTRDDGFGNAAQDQSG